MGALFLKDKNKNYQNENVTIYLFRGETCPYCENALNYFKSTIDNYPNINVISYEVWNNKENAQLKNAIIKELNIPKTSVPLFVIGDYYKIGFSDNGQKLIDKALEEINNENYQDVVANIIKENNFNLTPEKITSNS